MDIFIIQPVSRSYFGHSGAKSFTSVVKILQHSCLKQTWLFNISSTNVKCLISRVLLRLNSLMPHFVFANVSVHNLWVKMLTHFVRKSLMWGTIGQSLCGHVSCEICLLPFCICHIFSFFCYQNLPNQQQVNHFQTMLRGWANRSDYSLYPVLRAWHPMLFLLMWCAWMASNPSSRPFYIFM